MKYKVHGRDGGKNESNVSSNVVNRWHMAHTPGNAFAYLKWLYLRQITFYSKNIWHD